MEGCLVYLQFFPANFSGSALECFSFLKSIFCAKVNPIVYQGYKSVTVFILCWLVLTTEVSDNKASDS